MALRRWRSARRRTLVGLVVLAALSAMMVWAVRAALAVDGPTLASAATAAAPESAFQAAQARFLDGRRLQRLHRNTAASTEAFDDALSGFETVARGAERTPLGARALYMSGSTLLFLDRPEPAVARYGDVIRQYPDDPYAAKALLRKAQVEKNALDADAARRTAEAIEQTPTNEQELARLQRSLGVIGTPAPELETHGWIGGEPATLESLRGDVVVLYFFTTWCPNCKKEASFVRDLAARWRAAGVRVVGVTDHSRGQTDETVSAYAAEHGFDFPIAVDEAGRTSRAYQGGSVPTMVVIDGGGIVRWHDHPAALSDGVLERLTRELA